jgi:transketolase
MLRGDIPRLFDPRHPMRLNKARVLSTGSDITVFSSGICTEEAMRAIHLVKKRGISVSHLHVSTLKPFNDPVVLKALAENTSGVITMENHSVIGGLGSCVAEKMAEAGIAARLVRIGLRDTFAHGASRAYLMKELGIDARALIRGIEKLISRKLGITAKETDAVSLPVIPQGGNAESL